MHRLVSVSRTLLATSGALFFGLSAGAQCQLEWQSGPVAAGPVGSVNILAEAANGDLIAAGVFQVAGSQVVNNIARYDGTAWQAIGGGIDGGVQDVVVLPNGDLFAVGSFSSSGGVPVANAAIWNGTTWSSPGFGLDSYGTDLALLPNGNVAVVGDFDMAGGIANDGLAIWDGVAWTALPITGLNSIHTVAVDSNGELLVAGRTIPGMPDILRWNGTSWSTLPGIPTANILEVNKLAASPTGDLMIAGSLVVGGQSTQLAIYDGTQIQPLSPPVPVVGHNPPLVADALGGFLIGTRAPGSANTLAYRYNGVGWTAVGPTGVSGIGSILSLSNGSVVVGRMRPEGNAPFRSSVETFAGATWDPVGTAPAIGVAVTQALPNGNVVVGGSFSQMAGVAANNIARWDGSSWHALAQGVDGPVAALAVAPDGSLLVAGYFSAAGGAPAQRIARWSGSTWSTIGGGLVADRPHSIAQNDAGEIVVATSSQPSVHYYDGQVWSIPTTPTAYPNDVLAMPNGEFLLLGTFVELGQTSIVLSGGLRLAGGTATIDSDLIGISVRSGMLDANGDLLIATRINSANGVARVVGGVPQLLPIGLINGPVSAFDYLPNGDLLVAGDFNEAAQQPVGSIFRWDGSTVDDLGSGVAAGVGSSFVDSLTIGGSGDVFIAGNFLAVGGNVSVAMARGRTSCPAAAQSFGAGCTGSAGAVTLASDDMPWLGATWNAAATGMSAQSLAVHVVGDTSTVVPLPLGAAGCSLFVAPVIAELLVPQSGEARVAFAIPAVPVLIGNDLFSQVVGLELDASLALLQTTSTNALQLTIGSF